MNLSQLVGNRRLKDSLSRADHLPHAILLGGAKGSGRHTLARLLAQALVCDHPDSAPCGNCPNCKRVAQGIHPDVPPLSAFVSSKDKDKRNIVVDTIRALRADAFVRPNQARRKVYIIAPAEEMNPNAQNALLKVLEDGPEYVSFLLLAENPLSLLPTIRSRCVRYDLTPVGEGEALDFLRQRFPDRDERELKLAAELSGGILGRALEFLEGDSREDPKVAQCLNRFCSALGNSSELELMEWSVAVQNDKLSREQMSRFYQLVRERSLDALTGRPAGATLAALSRGQLTGLCDLAATGLEAMERNVSPPISAGWFAVSAFELCNDR